MTRIISMISTNDLRNVSKPPALNIQNNEETFSTRSTFQFLTDESVEYNNQDKGESYELSLFVVPILIFLYRDTGWLCLSIRLSSFPLANTFSKLVTV